MTYIKESRGTKVELIIIRHGQSEADLLGVHEGRVDFPLTVLGEQQARKMANYVAANYAPDIIVTSPLKRASKTAQILREAVGCELQYFDELMEYNNGILAGMDRKEAAINYPLPKNGRPIHMEIVGGESELQLRQRAEYMFYKILHDYKEFQRVAIVSHGGFISNFMKVFFKQHSESIIFATGDTGIHLVEITEDKRIIRFLNKQNHLGN